jgi:hypothetical protein
MGIAAKELAPPAPPGALGKPLERDATDRYLRDAFVWRERLRRALDDLDVRAREARDPDSYSADLALAWSLYQEITERHEQLATTFAGGRVGRAELEACARLVWGRLEGRATGALGVSLVEAGSLVTAMVQRLDERLAGDVVGATSVAARLAPLRATLARCRDLALDLGHPVAPIDALTARLDAARSLPDAERVQAEVAAIEHEALALERDLVVEHAARAGLGRDRERRVAELAEAIAEAEAVEALAVRCRERIVGPPRLAVPDPRRLGTIPPPVEDWRTDRAAIDAFGARLDRVRAALAAARQAYDAPLRERDALRGRLDAYRAMAGARGQAEDASLTAAYDAGRAALWTMPVDLVAAADLVSAYQSAVRSRSDGAAPDAVAGPGPTPEEGTSR